MTCENDYWNQMYAVACDVGAPSVIFKPRLFIDGNQWCALFGENLQDGVAGFGDSPAMAMRNFDIAWNTKIKAIIEDMKVIDNVFGEGE